MGAINDFLCGVVDVIEEGIDKVDYYIYENVTKPIDSVFYDTVAKINTECVHRKVRNSIPDSYKSPSSCRTSFTTSHYNGDINDTNTYKTTSSKTKDDTDIKKLINKEEDIMYLKYAEKILGKQKVMQIIKDVKRKGYSTTKTVELINEALAIEIYLKGYKLFYSNSRDDDRDKYDTDNFRIW